MTATYVLISELNGIEIYFNNKPDQSIIDTLKAARWRWHRVKKCWYHKQSDSTLETARNIASGDTAEPPKNPKADKQSAKVNYSVNISDYLTLEEYTDRIRAALADRIAAEERRGEDWTLRNHDELLAEKLEYYNSNDQYSNLKGYIRQAIIHKALGGSGSWSGDKRFYCNGSNDKYSAVWDKLPDLNVVQFAKLTENRNNEKRFYTSSWGYDQTNITIFEHIGKFNGLDVVVESNGEIHLVRIKHNDHHKFTVDKVMYVFGEPMTNPEAVNDYQSNDSWAAYGWAR